jgi:DNA invertase Pin-like site-specific DNA recombinase
MADAHKRKFDVVAVWKFDRFARSVSHLLRAPETLNALGIAFASLTVVPDARRIAALREQGLSWAKIAERLGIGEGTVYRTRTPPPKSPLLGGP